MVRGGKTPEIDLHEAERMGYKLAIVPGLLIKAAIGACDEALAALKGAAPPPVLQPDMTVREAFNRMGAEDWDALRTRFRPAEAAPRRGITQLKPGGFGPWQRLEAAITLYEPVENWAKLPPGWSFKEIGSVGVDKNDNVYVFNRGEHPMIVFDRDGNFLRSWGEGLFPRAHGVHMAPDDTIWLTDDGDHTVRQCTLEGKVLLTLGIPGKPAPYMSGEPFHRCTHTAMSPQGDIYVSDGYGNARVHKFSPERQAADVLGRRRAPIPASSTSCTTSPATATAGSMSPTARTTACRCSTATASTRRSGTTCIVPAACSCRLASARSATSASWVRCSRSTATCPISGRA